MESQKTTKNFTMKDRRGASVDEVAGVLDDEQRDRGDPTQTDRITAKL